MRTLSFSFVLLGILGVAGGPAMAACIGGWTCSGTHCAAVIGGMTGNRSFNSESACRAWASQNPRIMTCNCTASLPSTPSIAQGILGLVEELVKEDPEQAARERAADAEKAVQAARDKQIQEERLAAIRDRLLKDTDRSGLSLKIVDVPSPYIPSGRGFVGGMTWNFGFNIPSGLPLEKEKQMRVEAESVSTKH